MMNRPRASKLNCRGSVAARLPVGARPCRPAPGCRPRVATPSRPSGARAMELDVAGTCPDAPADALARRSCTRSRPPAHGCRRYSVVFHGPRRGHLGAVAEASEPRAAARASPPSARRRRTSRRASSSAARDAQIERGYCSPTSRSAIERLRAAARAAIDLGAVVERRRDRVARREQARHAIEAGERRVEPGRRLVELEGRAAHDHVAHRRRVRRRVLLDQRVGRRARGRAGRAESRAGTRAIASSASSATADVG